MNDQKNDRQKERQRMPQRAQENERELHSLNAYVLFIQDLHPLAFADVIFMTGKAIFPKKNSVSILGYL